MFVPCIIRRSRNNQRYALICTTSLFYILAPTCLDSSLPSSGRFLDRSELVELQMEWVVYHVSVSVCRIAQVNHGNPAHRPRNPTLYDIPPTPFVIQLTQKDLRISLIMAGYCRNM
jgi:hypothetical protein